MRISEKEKKRVVEASRSLAFYCTEQYYLSEVIVMHRINAFIYFVISRCTSSYISPQHCRV